MANKSQVLKIAEDEVGYLEKNNGNNLDAKIAAAGDKNYTKYWRDLNNGYQGQPWCNAFVNWIFIKAYGTQKAKELLCTGGSWSYYTPTSAGYFKAMKQWYTTPQSGDIIYFKNTQRIYHVGLVIAVDKTRVYTIEGNTSGGSGVEPNGGGVFKKSYLLTEPKIAGYGRPKYDEEYITKKCSYDKNGLLVINAANVRNEPVSGEITSGYAKGFYVQPTMRTSAINGVYWFRIQKGWISGKLIVGWIKDENGGWWYNNAGTYPKAEWLEIDNKFYYFNKDGYMVANCYVKSATKEEWYYLDSHGVWDQSKTVQVKPSNVTA